jgi:hypothetical protein
MRFLEKDLEQIIYESGRDSLSKKGLHINGKLFRQLKIGNYGIADLVEFQRPFYDGPNKMYFNHGMITIYELKKEQIGISAFLQAMGYLKGIDSYLTKKDFRDKYILNVVIIGREIDMSGSFCFIPYLLSIKNYNFQCDENFDDGEILFYTYNVTIDGIKFESKNGFNLKNQGF